MVVLAGFLAHQRLLHLPEVMLCAFAGSFVADQLLFYLGRRYREHRYVRRIREQPAFGKALDLVDRYPHGFILALRFLYGLHGRARGARVSRVSPLRFLALAPSRPPSGQCASARLGVHRAGRSNPCSAACTASRSKLAVAAGIGVAIWLAYHLYASHAGRRK